MSYNVKKILFVVAAFCMSASRVLLAGKDDVVEMEVVGRGGNNQAGNADEGPVPEWYDSTGDGTELREVVVDGAVSALDGFVLEDSDGQALVPDQAGSLPEGWAFEDTNRVRSKLERVIDWCRVYGYGVGCLSVVGIGTLIYYAASGIFTPEGQACLQAFEQWCDSIPTDLNFDPKMGLGSRYPEFCKRLEPLYRGVCENFPLIMFHAKQWHESCNALSSEMSGCCWTCGICEDEHDHWASEKKC
jgi:hypothetical protein